MNQTYDAFLVFDLWGDFAHFRKFYTSSSPLSYDFPTRTVLSGLIGALVGLHKSEYPSINELYTEAFKYESSAFSINILKSIKKARFNVNYIDTKRNWRLEKGARTQIRMEVVKEPKYRIYFSSNDKKIYEMVKKRLEEHTTYYTLCLGITEFLANYVYIGEYDASWETEVKAVKVNNVVPYDMGKGLNISAGDMYGRDILPVEINTDRVVTMRKEYIYKTGWISNDPYLLLKTNNYYRLENGENIVLL